MIKDLIFFVQVNSLPSYGQKHFRALNHLLRCDGTRHKAISIYCPFKTHTQIPSWLHFFRSAGGGSTAYYYYTARHNVIRRSGVINREKVFDLRIIGAQRSRANIYSGSVNRREQAQPSHIYPPSLKDMHIAYRIFHSVCTERHILRR